MKIFMWILLVVGYIMVITGFGCILLDFSQELPCYYGFISFIAALGIFCLWALTMCAKFIIKLN